MAIPELIVGRKYQVRIRYGSTWRTISARLEKITTGARVVISTSDDVPGMGAIERPIPGERGSRLWYVIPATSIDHLL